MGFRGAGGRGGGNRGSFQGGRGGGRGGGRTFDTGPPDYVVEVGHFAHKSENDLVCWTTCGKIPFFNAPVYFENKEQVGKIDEIFGSPQESGFTVKLSDGVKAISFKESQKLFIDPAKLLPVDRFLPGAKSFGGGRGRGGPRGGSRGGSRGGGGRGNSFGGRGGGGFNRGGSSGRGNFGSNDRGGGFRGRGGSRGDFRGGNRGGRDGGAGFKRPAGGSFGGSGGAQNKKIKFD